MTCRQLAPDVIDYARGLALEPSRHDAVTGHLQSCASCAALAERQRGMSRALRQLANEQTPVGRNDRQRERLLAAFDTHRSPSRRRLAIGVGLSLAASALIVAGLSIAWKGGTPAPRTPAAIPAAGDAAEAAFDAAQASPEQSRGASFVALAGASALPRFERGQVIRVEIPSPGGSIQADVLVGQDGLARAVRLIQ